MKLFGSAICVILSAPVAFSHYIFSQFILEGRVFAKYQYIRPVPIWNPLTDYGSTDLRCNRQGHSGAGTDVLTVKAGSTVGFATLESITHPGPYAAYLSPAPPNVPVQSYDGSGSWFKIWEKGTFPEFSTSTEYKYTWDMDSHDWNFTIPATTPNGEYLLRFEHIALHFANRKGGAEFYVSCAQIKVVGGGGGSPAPTVKIPGWVKAEDKGLLLDLMDVDTILNYNAEYIPGPPVWSG
ncbi:hypothetical protein MFIFM68171_06604 [Madurella fahalii]|uniref:lytic cellulose monooxygenase (C4-dehydrogenating) n=1 Tax=Madurella fahalii TaxID=1157608 RepID=A0ABQ0GFE5_9PEZI